jgi:hypothetical protein
MIWAQLLAYVAGTVDRELLLRNEYLATENRILNAQIEGRLLLSQEEKSHISRDRSPVIRKNSVEPGIHPCLLGPAARENS